MPSRFCSTCGVGMSGTERFCRSCGAAVAQDDQPAAGWTPDPAALPAQYPPAQQFGQPVPSDPRGYPPTAYSYGAPPDIGFERGINAGHSGSDPLLQFDVQYPERSSRLLIFVKTLLAIPHLAALYAIGALAGFVTVIAWFAILFTGRYPRGMWDFVVGFFRWNANVQTYLLLLRDEYPPFSTDEGRYPVRMTLAYPEHLSRVKIFFKWLLIIPNFVVLYLVMLGAMVATVAAWFVILFTGRYPRGLFDFVVGAMRWMMRVNVYLYLLTDHYPPFSMQPFPSAAPAPLPA